MSVDGDDVLGCGHNAIIPCKTIQYAVKIADQGGTLVLLQPKGKNTRPFIVSQPIQLNKSISIVGERGMRNVVIEALSSTFFEKEVASQATSSNERSPGLSGSKARKVKTTADAYLLRLKLRRNSKRKPAHNQQVNRSLSSKQIGNKKTSNGSSDVPTISFHLFRPFRPNLSVSARSITFKTIGFLETNSPANVSLIDCRLEGVNVQVVHYQGVQSGNHDSDVGSRVDVTLSNVRAYNCAGMLSMTPNQALEELNIDIVDCNFSNY